MRHTSREGLPVLGGEPLCTTSLCTVPKGMPRSLKDMILLKTKGGVDAPYATRPRNICGMDQSKNGVSYQSYSTMMLHRTKHIRTLEGPNERYGTAVGPPASSWDHGFGGQTLRPPRYPISSTVISKTQENIQQT